MPHRFSCPALSASAEANCKLASSCRPVCQAGIPNLSEKSAEVILEQGQAIFFPTNITPEDVHAIRCQAMVLELFMDAQLDYDALVAFSYEQGWCGGEQANTAEQLGALLEFNCIEVTRYQHAGVYELTHELAQGHMVILSVQPSSDYGVRRPNSEIHSVFRVLQIDTTNRRDIHVLIQDPVTATQIASYSLLEFIAYWRDRQFSIVATKKPAPIWAPGMVNFDYGRGNIDNILGKSFAEFCAFEAAPKLWRLTMLPDRAYIMPNISEQLSDSVQLAINDTNWDAQTTDITASQLNLTVNV